MNENEIKKDIPIPQNEKPETGNAQVNVTKSEDVKVYTDIDIFDFDAHRKAKAEEEKKIIEQKRTAAASAVSVNQNVRQQNVNNTPQNKPTEKKTVSTSHAKTRPQIKDISGEKVIYGSSAELRRKPVTNKEKKTLFAKKKDKQPSIKPVEEKYRGANPLVVLSKSLLYIALILGISCLCAYFVIMVSNDVFAFVKPPAQIEVVIPEYATIDEIAEELHDKQIIKYPKIFVLYTMIRGNDPGKYNAGVYTVSPTQNYDELLYTFVPKKSSGLTEVSVTIPEGYTVDDIIKLLVEEKGIGTKEGFVDAIQNGEYDYWFVEELKDLNPNRKYRLEGYLYPDTYYFYKEWEETKIIDKILANFYAKFSIKYKQECEKAGKSVDYIINLASIVQMEAKYPTDYSMVSSVIHNRLKSAYYNYRLDCDATIQYFLPERKEDLSHEDTLIDNPYNSYKNSGLPPGPISNPTLKAIRAALYPEQTTQPYYFFVSDVDGHMLYGRNYAEHQANIAKVDANAAAAKKESGAG